MSRLNMDITIQNIKSDLTKRMVKLLESERGMASKLAKTIGKTATYFSEIKRGNPVNAIHLKAVANVFGPGKVDEILGTFTTSTRSTTLAKAERLAEIQMALAMHSDKLSDRDIEDIKEFIEFKLSKAEEK